MKEFLFFSDTTPPVFISCPENMTLNPYDTLQYMPPIASDNSNYTCVTLESGPPNGTVIGSNTFVRYKASDGRNEAFCEFTINVTGK